MSELCKQMAPPRIFSFVAVHERVVITTYSYMHTNYHRQAITACTDRALYVMWSVASFQQTAPKERKDRYVKAYCIVLYDTLTNWCWVKTKSTQKYTHSLGCPFIQFSVRSSKRFNATSVVRLSPSSHEGLVWVVTFIDRCTIDLFVSSTCELANHFLHRSGNTTASHRISRVS